VQAVMQRSFEQRIAIKFCVKLGKSAMETLPMKTTFDDDCLSDRQVYRWHKAFLEDRGNLARNLAGSGVST